MDDKSPSYPQRALAGMAVALVVGVTVIATCNTIWAIAHNFPLFSLWDDASISQIITVSAPFILLAIFGIKAPRPWIVGFCLTGAFWGFYTYVITRPYEGGGANIGLGILMMFSPITIAGASLLSLVTPAGGGAQTK